MVLLRFLVLQADLRNVACFWALQLYISLFTFRISLWILSFSSTFHPQHAGTPDVRPQDPFWLANHWLRCAYWKNRGARPSWFQRCGLAINMAWFHIGCVPRGPQTDEIISQGSRADGTARYGDDFRIHGCKPAEFRQGGRSGCRIVQDRLHDEIFQSRSQRMAG